MPTITRQISGSNDDGSKSVYGGGWAVGDLITGESFFSGDYTAGLRFNNIAIPQGATITSASIRLQATLGVSINLQQKVYGIAEDDTASMVTDPTGRTKTSANVDWDIINTTSNANYDSPDLKTIVQEIVNRAGWVSGSDMGFLILDDGSNDTQIWKDYSESAPNSAILTINYVSPVTSQQITKALVYKVIGTPGAPQKKLRYRVVDPESYPVVFSGVKVGKANVNALNTNDPDRLNFISQKGTLKYFIEGFGSFIVDETIDPADYTVVSDPTTHNLGFYPIIFVFAKDNLMTNFEPLGVRHAGSGAERRISYIITKTQLFIKCSGFNLAPEVFRIDYYYKIFKNNLKLG